MTKTFRCNICILIFQSQGSLNIHNKAVHESHKYHKCDSCGKSFSQAGNLKTHVDSVHNKQKKITNVTHVERHFLKHGS